MSMNKNLAIGALVVVVLLGGGYFLWSQSNAVPGVTAPTTNTPTTQNPSPSSSSADTPVVTTDRNVAPSSSTVVVTGHVIPNGAPTTYWYEYGESTALGSRISSQAIGSGFISISSPGYVTGLRANTTYYFRLSAQNRYGTVNGTTYSFKTNTN